MDDKSSITKVDCPAVLKVVCGPPDIERKVQEISDIYIDRHSSTYPISGVALENDSVDLDICFIGINCTTLVVVACPPPGIGVTI